MIRKVRKKIATVLTTTLAVSVFVTTTRADIGQDLGDFFSSISTTSHGIYKSQQRGYATLGGVTYKAPTLTINPITVSPPRFSAGCQGIDFTFGSISYLNLNQLVKWINTVITKNAPGLIVEMAINKYAPGLKTVLNEINSLATMINQMTLDSCAASKALVSAMFGDTGQIEEAWNSAVKTASTLYGTAEDAFTALRNIRNDLSNTVKDVEKTGYIKDFKDFIKEWHGDVVVNTIEDKLGTVSPTSTDMKTTFARFLASVMGTAIIKHNEPISNNSTEDRQFDVTYVQPVLDLKDLIDGVSAPNIAFVYKLKSDSDASGSFVSVDENNKEDAYYFLKSLCQSLVNTYGNGTGVCQNGDGLAKGINYVLRDILYRIETKQPLTAGEKEFVKIAPLPVLKWLNVMSFYPGTGESLIGAMSPFIATTFVETLVDEVTRNIASYPPSNAPEDIKKVYSVVFANAGRLKDNIRAIREQQNYVLRSYNEFANFVNHYEKALSVKLAQKGIFMQM